MTKVRPEGVRPIGIVSDGDKGGVEGCDDGAEGESGGVVISNGDIFAGVSGERGGEEGGVGFIGISHSVNAQ